jgi:predicted permease membrane protein
VQAEENQKGAVFLGLEVNFKNSTSSVLFAVQFRPFECTETSGLTRLAFSASSRYKQDPSIKWLENYATANPVAYSILLVSLIAVIGLGLASIKIRGVGLGVTGVLFAGLIFGHLGFHLEHHTMEFLREFGLILFVFTIGLQIGPGFFAKGSGTGVE